MVITEMAEQVCRKILERLNAAGVETKQISFQEMQDRNVGALSRPVVNISINSATFNKITLTTYKCILGLILYLMISDLRGEEQRRFQILNLIEAIVNALFLRKLGLELQNPLMPLSFANVTDEKYASAGYQLYELRFSCSFNYTKETVWDDVEDLGLLETIVTNYFLQDPKDDGVADATGKITLVGIS